MGAGTDGSQSTTVSGSSSGAEGRSGRPVSRDVEVQDQGVGGGGGSPGVDGGE